MFLVPMHHPVRPSGYERRKRGSIRMFTRTGWKSRKAADIRAAHSIPGSTHYSEKKLDHATIPAHSGFFTAPELNRFR